ncbi:hypothetical protein GCM10027347_53690 [Larkinella harenae]
MVEISNLAKIATWIYTGLILLVVMLPLNGDGQHLGKINDNYVLQIRLDYLAHFLLFVPWVVLLAYGYRIPHRGSIWIGLSYVPALTFALSCELLQRFLPYRTFNVNDLVANFLGVTLGYLLVGFWARLTKKAQRVT